MPNRKQLRFYKFLVVNVGFQAVFPAKTREEAEALSAEMDSRGDDTFIVDARWNDDARLFWSGTQTGYPIDE